MSPETTGNLIYLILLLIFGFGLSICFRQFFHFLEQRQRRQHPDSFHVLLFASLKSPIYWTIIGLTLHFAIYALDWAYQYQRFINQLLITYLILVWSRACVNFCLSAINSAARQNQSQRSPIKDAVPFLSSLTRLIILFLGIYLIFLTWGVNLTPLIALLSVIGAALSFAARDVVGNVLSGMSIFFSRPFQVGDFVKIDDQIQGSVKEIGLQMTQIQAEDESLINVPNTILVTKSVINRMAMKKYFPLVLPLSLPLLPDYADLSRQILDRVNENKWLLPEPKPKLRFKKFTDKNVEAHLIVPIEKIDLAAKVRHQLTLALATLLHPSPTGKNSTNSSGKPANNPPQT